ncbi:MAG: flagellar basal body P-ring formation chaperone FlgA [Desulfobacterium sp.]
MLRLRHIHIFLIFALIVLFDVQGGSANALKANKNNDTQGYQTISQDLFRQAFGGFVSQYSGRDAANVVISKFKVLRDVPVPPGNVQIRVIPNRKNKLVEYLRLKAEVRVNGVLQNKVTLCAWLDIFETVVCVSHNLKRGRVIQQEDLYLERRNISGMADDVVLDLNQVVGLMAKHNIKADDVLKQWVLKRNPVVKRGDMVTILVQSGGMRITVPGKVLSDGFKGQAISVLNTMSNKKIFARVIDTSTVQVDI